MRGLAYAWDEAPGLCMRKQAKHLVVRVYDGFGRIVHSEFNNGTSIEALDYEFDANGNLTSLTYPAEMPFTVQPATGGARTLTIPRRKVFYTYDSNNRLKTVTDWNNRLTTYTYDLGGRLVRKTLPNTALVTFDTDSAGRVNEIKDACRKGSVESCCKIPEITFQVQRD